MMDFPSFMLTVFSSAATAVALLGCLAWMLRTWLSQRLKSGIQHEYDARLASLNSALKEQTDAASSKLNSSLKEQTDAAASRLKAAFDRESDKLQLVSQSLGEAQKSAISKRLLAIEKTWLAALQISDAVPPAVSTLDVLTETEIVEAHNYPNYLMQLNALDAVKVSRPIMEFTRNLAEQRPYIGEYLWALYGVYQAVALRIIYLVDASRVDPKRRLWSQDKVIRQNIESALGKSELDAFDAQLGGKYLWIQDRFSRAILKATEKIIAGSEFSEAALRQAEIMEERIRQSSLEKQKN